MKNITLLLMISLLVGVVSPASLSFYSVNAAETAPETTSEMNMEEISDVMNETEIESELKEDEIESESAFETEIETEIETETESESENESESESESESENESESELESELESEIEERISKKKGRSAPLAIGDVVVGVDYANTLTEYEIDEVWTGMTVQRIYDDMLDLDPSWGSDGEYVFLVTGNVGSIQVYSHRPVVIIFQNSVGTAAIRAPLEVWSGADVKVIVLDDTVNSCTNNGTSGSATEQQAGIWVYQSGMRVNNTRNSVTGAAISGFIEGTEDGKLTIQGGYIKDSLQPYQGNGILTVTGGGYSAGIGGSANQGCGTIIIEGGIINAFAYQASGAQGIGNGAGIGAGGGHTGGGGTPSKILIHGHAKVTAKSIGFGAGIGGAGGGSGTANSGLSMNTGGGDGGKIEIGGSAVVIAESGERGAGIGGGGHTNFNAVGYQAGTAGIGGDILIHENANITIKSNGDGAGIGGAAGSTLTVAAIIGNGGADGGSGGTIQIKGTATVKIEVQGNGAGIGGGGASGVVGTVGGVGGTIEIADGVQLEITAKGNGAGIGGGGGSTSGTGGDTGIINISGSGTTDIVAEETGAGIGGGGSTSGTGGAGGVITIQQNMLGEAPTVIVSSMSGLDMGAGCVTAPSSRGVAGTIEITSGNVYAKNYVSTNNTARVDEVRNGWSPPTDVVGMVAVDAEAGETEFVFQVVGPQKGGYEYKASVGSDGKAYIWIPLGLQLVLCRENGSKELIDYRIEDLTQAPYPGMGQEATIEIPTEAEIPKLQRYTVVTGTQPQKVTWNAADSLSPISYYYEIDLPTITISKMVKGEMGDTTFPFEFKITFEQSDGTPYAAPIDYKIMDKDGTPLTGLGNAGTISGTGEHIFSLKHTQMIEFSAGDLNRELSNFVKSSDISYTITEADYSGDNYTVYVNNVTGNTRTAKVAANDRHEMISFVNAKGAVVPTGIMMETNAWLMLTVSALVLLTVVFLAERKFHRRKF